ncbi:MAG TPA: hypothetical protein VNX66_19065 [Candidatus Sulfotelmatobacter sp.]|nr:hypothetical protein [Candidatus Sulfotelmatobacter sp.]
MPGKTAQRGRRYKTEEKADAEPAKIRRVRTDNFGATNAPLQEEGRFGKRPLQQPDRRPGGRYDNIGLAKGN